MAQCLVIEESPVVASILARLLAQSGHEVAVARTAEEGIAALDPDCTVNIAFLDWDLPNLGALDVLEALHRQPRQCGAAVVICATENDPRQFALARAAGAGFHLLKPVDEDALNAVIQWVLAARAAPGQSWSSPARKAALTVR